MRIIELIISEFFAIMSCVCAVVTNEDFTIKFRVLRKMKIDLHPKCNNIVIKTVSGETFSTSSTWGKEGDTLVLETDVVSHPAWLDQRFNTRVSSKGQVQKFQQKFSVFGDKKS